MSLGRVIVVLTVGILTLASGYGPRGDAAEIVDTWADTWATTDGLGRTLIDHEQAGPPRPDRFVGIFYFLWLGQHGTGGPYDVTRILAAEPDAMNRPTSPPWGPARHYHHWGESLFGYYFSDDAWVLRKHAQMLSDANIAVIIFDVTNQVTYRKVYTRLCEVFAAVRRDGGRTPQIAFLCPFWDPRKVVDELYADLYKPGLHADLWFHWKGKPLILADPAKVSDEVKDFFTFRAPQPDYFKGPAGPDQWGWLEIHPQHVYRNSAGEAEQMTVGVGQNGSGRRLCAFSEADTYGRSWHRGARDTRPGAVNHGFNIAEQWERALEVDPQFIFITGWNEWIAMRLDEFAGVRKPVMFVDLFTQEYGRDIEPMKGGHADHYYYQMVNHIRRFKGVRPGPAPAEPMTITIDGRFADWRAVRPEFRDDRGDTLHRDHPAYDDIGRYENRTGRNDFLSVKVAGDVRSVYFYARTAQPITPPTDRHWMMLFIDADGDAANGWEGYDFIVNRRVKDATSSILEHSAGGWAWRPRGEVAMRVNGQELELAIPRDLLGWTGSAAVPTFQFKWSDNLQEEGDILDFTLNGDTAPNARFRYVYPGTTGAGGLSPGTTR